MTEQELLDLLGDVRPDYIAQVEAFRQGQMKRRQPGITKFLSMAAVLAVLLLAGTVAMVFLAPNWKKEAPSAAPTEMRAFSAETEAAAQERGEVTAEATWQTEILNGTGSFYSQDYEKEMTFPSYTEEVRRERGTADISPWRYALLDMDADGMKELVIQYRLEENGYFYGEEETQVFWKAGERTLERGYYVRQMSHIRADGAFYWSGSSSEHGWSRLTGLNGETPGVVDIPEDQSGKPEPDWHSFDGGDQHSQAGPSPEELLRVKNRAIRYVNADNVEMTLDTELFIGKGYSICMPLTGWNHEKTVYQGSEADRWVCEDNENAWMMITKFGGDEERVKKIVRETETSWSFFEDKQGNFYADHEGQVMNIRFIQAEVETFVVMETYPMNTYEGPGRLLSILNDTFDRWPREVVTWYPEG